SFFFFQAEDGIRDFHVTGVRRVLFRSYAPTLRGTDVRKLPDDVVLDCGWGRLIFAHTFKDPRVLAKTMTQEGEDARDIAFYLNRSEERRVGKECRTRWAPGDEQKEQTR